MLKWFRIVMAMLIAIFSILWGILICIDNSWNIWLCIPIGLGIFILIYGFFWLCMFTAEKITNAFAKVYHEKVVPRTKQAAIDKYKEENPPVITVVPEEKVNVEEPTIPEHQERLVKFMEKCDKERRAYISKKKEADAEKLEKILLYTRNTLLPFDFTDEELFQVCEAIRSLAIHKVILPNIPVKIERTGKKTKLTNHDLSNFGWNIANQFEIPTGEIVEFLSTTFKEWFKNTEPSTIAKNLRNTRGHHNIEIDTNILDIDLVS